jgi:His-Xaa-Ser system protein HxsD
MVLALDRDPSSDGNTSLIISSSSQAPVHIQAECAGSETIRYQVSTDLYSKEAIFRACYQFTDRCFLFLEPAADGAIVVEFRKRHPSADLDEIAGSFANELINQKVRADIARETQGIRQLIVAQAFSGADFRDPVS